MSESMLHDSDDKIKAVESEDDDRVSEWKDKITIRGSGLSLPSTSPPGYPDSSSSSHELDSWENYSFQLPPLPGKRTPSTKPASLP
ncbi:hypothetical protein C1H46_043353 [Malus baccata]|uniref:Uncharacterized protein n=1 Tax=Malus baccata TaxID=106549 RepID=A0A540KAZ6_MALBA|nr:hypothetical protein C1H46_043353 [Malus baccata]